MNYKTDTYKGNYILTNPEKFCSPRPPAFKSRWEKKIFIALDNNPFVPKWGYESIEVYYQNPVYQKWSVYYPDIFCSVISPDGSIRVLMIEIKPAKYTQPPKKPNQPKSRDAKSIIKHQTSLKRYENEWRDWLVNQSKWNAARAWCLKNKVEWLIITERNVDGFFNSGSI